MGKDVPFCDVPSCPNHVQLVPRWTTYLVVTMPDFTLERVGFKKYAFGMMRWRVCDNHGAYTPGYPAPDWLVELMTGVKP